MMNRFLLKTITFVMVVLILLTSGVILLYQQIDKGKYYLLDPTYKNLIFGHSHTECAFNDSKIDSTLNLSNGGEGNFYIYFKVKKILENNTVKNIFISFTNDQVSLSNDSGEIWKEKYINKWYSKYAAYFDSESQLLLLRNNPASTIKAQSLASKKYIAFLLGTENNIIKDLSWGRFNDLKRNKTDSLIKHLRYQPPLKGDYKFAVYSLQSLDRIIALCKTHHTRIFFVRSPVCKYWPDLKNEYFFQKIRKERYGDVDFLDFKDFPVPLNNYGDLDHLNHEGSSKFSVFFNHLLKDGLQDKINKQEFIDQEMKRLTTSGGSQDS